MAAVGVGIAFFKHRSFQILNRAESFENTFYKWPGMLNFVVWIFFSQRTNYISRYKTTSKVAGRLIYLKRIEAHKTASKKYLALDMSFPL